MYRPKIFVLCLLIFVFCISCSSKTSELPEDSPDVGVSPQELNTKLRLTAPDGWNSFEIDDVVGLEVEIISNDEIAFTYDYGARMFTYQDNQWVAIPDMMEYPDGYFVLSKSNNDPFKIGSAALDPILNDKDRPVTLRIFIIGNIYQDGEITTERTAAYIDLELKPK